MEKMAHFFSFKIPKVGWIVAAIILLASFLRLYRISDYMTFLGDEGRDVLVAKGILEGNFTLLGPRASAGDFFLGPIYYYFIAPFLWFFRLDPVGPAVFVALVGIATVYLVYLVGKELIGQKAGIFAAALYAVSPLVIAYSRSSWNPNPMPFVSLLTLFLTYKAIKNPTWKKFVSIGFLLGISLQLHYLATFLIVITGMFLLIGTYYQRRNFDLGIYIKNFTKIFFGFIVGFSPFLFFELRHGFPNTKTITNFVLGNLSSNPPYTGSATFLEIIGDVFFRLFGRLLTRFPAPDQIGTLVSNDVASSWQVLTILLAALSLVFLLKIKNKLALILLTTWFVIGIALFGLYKKPIYDYYFGLLFPLPFLIVGNFISVLWEQKQFLRILSLGIFVYLIAFNLLGAPFRFEPNRQKDQVRKISEFVISKTDNKPYNFALLTPGNSDHAYRYYFEVLGHKPISIENIINDPQRKTVTEQLLIVCEDPDCKPLGHPLFEVSNFGRAEIVGEWNVSVVKVFKLVHYRER